MVERSRVVQSVPRWRLRQRWLRTLAGDRRYPEASAAGAGFRGGNGVWRLLDRPVHPLAPGDPGARLVLPALAVSAVSSSVDAYRRSHRLTSTPSRTRPRPATVAR